MNQIARLAIGLVTVAALLVGSPAGASAGTPGGKPVTAARHLISAVMHEHRGEALRWATPAVVRRLFGIRHGGEAGFTRPRDCVVLRRGTVSCVTSLTQGGSRIVDEYLELRRRHRGQGAWQVTKFDAAY